MIVFIKRKDLNVIFWNYRGLTAKLLIYRDLPHKKNRKPMDQVHNLVDRGQNDGWSTGLACTGWHDLIVAIQIGSDGSRQGW